MWTSVWHIIAFFPFSYGSLRYSLVLSSIKNCICVLPYQRFYSKIAKKLEERNVRFCSNNVLSLFVISKWFFNFSCHFFQMLKVWKIDKDGFALLHSQAMHMGELHSLRFSPDSGAVVAVGGVKEDLIRVVPLDKFEAVRTAFSNE